MASVRAMAGGPPAPAAYMVRNTFIELEPSPEEEGLDSARAFQTWPLARPPTPEAAARPAEREAPEEPPPRERGSPAARPPARPLGEDLEDGEVPDEEEEESKEEPRPPAAAPAATATTARELGELPEEGELTDSEEGELSSREEGELPEDGELPPRLAPARAGELPPPGLATPSHGPGHGAAVPPASLRSEALEDGRPAQFGSIFVTTPTQDGCMCPNPFATTPTKDGFFILPNPFVTTPTKELEAAHSIFVTSPTRELGLGEPRTPGPEGQPTRASGVEADATPPGSKGHADGLCKPCAWMHKTAAGCKNGASCEYCHLCPSGELKKRKKDKMQGRMGAFAAAARGSQPRPPPSASPGAFVESGSPGHPRSTQAFPSDPPALGRGGADAEPRYVALPGLLAQAPPAQASGLPRQMSLGSMAHGTGNCKPCAWAHKDAAGCRNGSHCSYCHLCPPGELKRRKREKWEQGLQSPSPGTDPVTVISGLAAITLA